LTGEAVLVTLATTLLALVAGAAFGRRRAQGRSIHSAQQRAWRVEEALDSAQAQVARAQSLLDATGLAVSDAVIHVDARGRVQWATPAARQRFDLGGSPPPTLMAAVRSVDLQDIVEAAAVGQPEVSSVHIRERAYRVGVVKQADGGSVIALRDDTELERLGRARRDLVANVSHDLRTPLTSIGLLADALLAPVFDDAGRREAVIAQIRDQIKTLEALADGMVELNQLESGRALLRLQPTALVDLVRAAVDGITPQLVEHRVQAVVDIPAGIQVLADGPQVIRVLTNLLDNARRFSPEGGVIQVSAQAAEEPDRVEVAIRDEGPGIPPGDMERIFERFYRGDRARTRRSAGLGLAIARHVVTGHGGRIWAENNAGRGATVRFTLPGVG
jgi:two-component system phosphate regulon sensor histidine kinase PhoR